MGNTKIFENWTFTRGLPEPFLTMVSITGKKDTTEESSLSAYNQMTRGRRATLHGATLRGLMLASDIVHEGSGGAFGVQKKRDKIKFFCGEFSKNSGASQEIRVLVYQPLDGKWRAALKRGSVYDAFPKIADSGASGKEMFAVLAYASTVNGPLYNEEFSENFKKFCKERESGFPNADEALRLGFLCCDNLYRRLENRDSLGDAGIPFDNDSVAMGNVPMLQNARLRNGYYSPSQTDYGTFEVLQEKEEPVVLKTLGELKDTYDRHLNLTDQERALVPALPDFYQVSEEVSEIVEAVTNTPMRVFMSAGESGTGKTTNAKMVAQLLGMPYYFFTCGEGTDEVDLVSSMIPNTGGNIEKSKMEFPTFTDMLMDPATALADMGHVYEEDIDQEDAFQKILELAYQKGVQNGRDEKDYVMVESSIITACRRPAVIEIQEPSVITKPGTLVKLNGLLDDGAAITLTNGEVVRRNPETIVLLTTNMGYKGCRGFNESVISRMRMVLYSEPLTADQMVERIRKKVESVTVGTLKQMAKCVKEIQKYCQTEMITGGVCGYREYEDWVWAYAVQKDICKAAKRTIVAKAAPEAEEREMIYKTQILTQFEEGKAA